MSREFNAKEFHDTWELIKKRNTEIRKLRRALRILENFFEGTSGVISTEGLKAWKEFCTKALKSHT